MHDASRGSMRPLCAATLLSAALACSGGPPAATSETATTGDSSASETVGTGDPATSEPTATTAMSTSAGETEGTSTGVDLPPSTLALAILSSRPEWVSGGDALVEIRLPNLAAAADVVVLAGDVDVSAAFDVAPGDRLLGVVEGLALGDTELAASLPGEAPATLTVTNYPISGPMLSGPHQQPFVCRTEASGLGPPEDADCSVETRYEYFYQNTQGMFLPLADPERAPADVNSVTIDALTVPYIVRVERGTINRAIYQITTLYDPGAPAWTARTPQPQWTGKVVYAFRGGCGVGHHQGGLGVGDDLAQGVSPLGDAAVRGGMAMISSSLNTLGTNCNDVLTAETAMMVKERFIERYGVPLYTIGWGGSGGSIQQHTLAENYPGILDGIVPGVSYPDIVSIYPEVMDCPLLVDYFVNRSEGNFADPGDQAAVSGYANADTCVSWLAFGLFHDPTAGCDASVPADQIYHPVNNPGGVRCTFVDNIKNLVGVDPETGFARQLYDNEGIQYGLAALNAGAITREQFLHLNENIGGYVVDGVFQAERSAADPLGLRAAYEGGRVVRGDLGLRTVPIVDLRLYTDDLGDIHDRVRTFSTRDRLIAANGHADNHVSLISVGDPTAYTQAAIAAVVVLDAWLTALASDDQEDRAAAVIAARPPGLTDLCFDTPGQDPKPGGCEALLPVHSSPRMVAGAARRGDALKCARKPIELDDYAVTFTAQELDRLMKIFPDGVCDWEVPGVEQAPAKGTWLSFGE